MPQTLPRLSRLALLSVTTGSVWATEESLPPLTKGKIPTNLEELCGSYDRAKEPLETQVVREWTEGKATFRPEAFTVGTFKDTPARMANFYVFPTVGNNLPGILQIHGGGQRASIDAARNTAANGYAGFSINWGDRKMDLHQAVDPATDWGAIALIPEGRPSDLDAVIKQEIKNSTDREQREHNQPAKPQHPLAICGGAPPERKPPRFSLTKTP